MMGAWEGSVGSEVINGDSTGSERVQKQLLEPVTKKLGGWDRYLAPRSLGKVQTWLDSNSWAEAVPCLSLFRSRECRRVQTCLVA